jgi:GNAT superfamily N-acetyltransferase
MADVTIHECAPNDATMQRFLDREWPLVEPPPWITTRVAFIAERDGTIIGAATGRVHAGVAHLNELMVTGTERSAGIGARLLEVFEDWAAARGAHLYELETRRDGPAQRFYERHGWLVRFTREGYYNHAAWVVMTKVP